MIFMAMGINKISQTMSVDEEEKMHKEWVLRNANSQVSERGKEWMEEAKKEQPAGQKETRVW